MTDTIEDIQAENLAFDLSEPPRMKRLIRHLQSPRRGRVAISADTAKAIAWILENARYTTRKRKLKLQDMSSLYDTRNPNVSMGKRGW